MAEGGRGRGARVCPKTQDTRGDECSLLLDVISYSAKGFSRPFSLARKYLFAFVYSIRSTLHLRISTISTKSTCIYIYVYLNIRSLSRFSSISSRVTKKTRKMRDRNFSRERRLIWREEL